MSILFYILLALIGCLLAGISVCSPSTLANNAFLTSYMESNALSLISVIVTVTLVSITQVHLEYTRVERRLKQKIFGDARRSVNYGAVALLFSLLISLIIMIIGSNTEVGTTPRAFVISGLIWITVLSIMIMWSIVHVVNVLASEEPVEDSS